MESNYLDLEVEQLESRVAPGLLAAVGVSFSAGAVIGISGCDCDCGCSTHTSCD